jgi:hypothetical protein
VSFKVLLPRSAEIHDQAAVVNFVILDSIGRASDVFLCA